MKTVIFDMDGVIFDSENLDRDCWREAAKEFGIDRIDEILYKCIGSSSESINKRLKEFYGQEFDAEGFRAETYRLFDDYVETKGMPLKAGIRELLDYLHTAGWKIGLASSTSYDRVKRQLTDTGLVGYFDDIVGGGMFERGKPDPEIFLLSCSRLGGIPEETFVIEDSYNGIRAGFAAGMKTIMVPDLLEPDKEMEEKSRYIIRDLFKLREFFYLQ